MNFETIIPKLEPKPTSAPIKMSIQDTLDFIWKHQYEAFSNVIIMLKKHDVNSRDIKIAIDAYVFDVKVIR
jgi:hypothetical protein